jgi:serine/threonine protein phosphatase PrpC
MLPDCLEFATATDVGLVRSYNEDSVAVDASAGIVVLADGMGGHRAGEVASRMATDNVLAYLKSYLARLDHGAAETALSKGITRAVSKANRAIYELGRSRPDYEGMGTTLAAAVFFSNTITLANVGDSRVYRLRGNRLMQLSREDSLLRHQVQVGLISQQETGQSHNRGFVTQALGIGEQLSPHVIQESANPGDVFLICSDGLTDLVGDGDIGLILGALEANLPLAATHLVQLANDLGGRDNVTVALVKVSKAFPSADTSSWTRRLFGWIK